MSKGSDSPDRSSKARQAGAGAFVGAFLIYILLANVGGGVDLEDRLTFDQSGELELEGIGIMLGLVAAAAIGIPLGTYVALRKSRAPNAGVTALVVTLPTWAVTWVAQQIVPSGPEDPVVLPFFVFGAWFLVPYLTRKVFERPNTGPQPKIDPRF